MEARQVKAALSAMRNKPRNVKLGLKPENLRQTIVEKDCRRIRYLMLDNSSYSEETLYSVETLNKIQVLESVV